MCVFVCARAYMKMCTLKWYRTLYANIYSCKLTKIHTQAHIHIHSHTQIHTHANATPKKSLHKLNDIIAMYEARKEGMWCGLSNKGGPVTTRLNNSANNVHKLNHILRFLIE